VSELPPEDQPGTISIGPVHGIPVFHDDDPRLAEDRARWSEAARIAQSLVSADELLSGLADSAWRVRHEVIPRLVARASDDHRTVPALLTLLHQDPSWEVRSAVAMALHRFDRPDVRAALRRAGARDDHSDVRWSAEYSLGQIAPN